MHIAIETRDRPVSYGMLQQAYRRFAFSMPGLGTQRGEIVATFLPRLWNSSAPCWVATWRVVRSCLWRYILLKGV